MLQKSLVAQHRQTLKVREWHFLAPHPDEHPPATGDDAPRPLPPGNPSRGYVPDGIAIVETSDRLELVLPGQKRPVVYHSWASVKKQGARDRVLDVFITGEGHSAWGQFNLVGRVRPSDGYISLSKEYVRPVFLCVAYMHTTLTRLDADRRRPRKVAVPCVHGRQCERKPRRTVARHAQPGAHSGL